MKPNVLVVSRLADTEKVGETSSNCEGNVEIGPSNDLEAAN